MQIFERKHPTMPTDHFNKSVKHQTINLNGIEIFYRVAGRSDNPALLLPHGYPCSSYQYRHLIPALSDKYYLIAPDLPGFGYSATPDEETFQYDFDGYAKFLKLFTEAIGLNRFALYLHDYGSQIGFRLAILQPEKISALIIQNGDIYEDTLGPKYETLKTYWRQPSPELYAKLEKAVSENGFRDEFVGEIDEDLIPLIPQDLWKLHWPLMQSQLRKKIMVGLMEGLKENLQWFPKYQKYLREHQPPTLIVWGPQDGYMPKSSAEAYLRDLPNAELQFVRGGHWALETNLEEITAHMRQFLSQVL
jgi:pimeloyl-ACP methyl ester carboxylesterase